MKHLYIYAIGALCIPAFLLSGCKKSGGLTEAYSLETREELILAADNGAATADLFASDLCVLSEDTPGTDTELTAEAAALFNVSDATAVFSKNSLDRMYPASTTKVMTAIIALEEGNLSDQVTVTDAAVITEAGASLAKIKPGDVLTLEQLVYGLMLPSGNDAANAIAVHMSGSVEAFAERMNQKALKLGATGTHFTNPSGLNNDQHYTTAYDLYLMFNEALKNPKFKEIIETPSYTANYVNGAGEPVSTTWETGNWYQKGEIETPAGLTVVGGKTGTTQAAGYCLIMASDDSQGKKYISVVLKAGNRKNLYDNMTQIISKIVN